MGQARMLNATPSHQLQFQTWRVAGVAAAAVAVVGRATAAPRESFSTAAQKQRI